MQEVAQSSANGVQANDANLDGNPMTSVLNTRPPTAPLTLNPDGVLQLHAE